MVKCDMLNGPCACGSWHKRGDGTFGQPRMWANGLPNGGDPTPPVDCDPPVLYPQLDDNGV